MKPETNINTTTTETNGTLPTKTTTPKDPTITRNNLSYIQALSDKLFPSAPGIDSLSYERKVSSTEDRYIDRNGSFGIYL